MQSKPRILVTSSSGKTGLATALRLLEDGYPVRAFVRRDDQRAKRLASAGAEIFIGDQYAIGDMRRAMAGMQRAYLCPPAMPNGLHFGTIFAAVAREAGIEHVVTLGQWLAQPSHPSLFTREVWLVEQLVEMLPDATHTVINVGWFADNYFMVLEPAAQLGLLPMPLGEGDVAKNAPPSNEDIGAVCAKALADPQSHAGRTYRPTGPEMMSPNQIAAAMGRALGRTVRYVDVSESMFMKAVSALRPPNYTDEMLTQLRLYAEEYRRGTFAVSGPTTVVRDITGREAEDFETIARRVIQARPEATRSARNRLRALSNFARILVTRRPDPEAIERRAGHVLLAKPQFSQDSAEWARQHDISTGYLPDHPRSSEDMKVLSYRAAANNRL